MSNFRRVKNSHVFVTNVKNSFEYFTLVTNTYEFFTRVTESFECEVKRICHKNSNVFVTPVKNSCELFTDVTNTYDFFTSVKDSHECFTSVIRSHDVWLIHKKRIYNAFIFTAAYLPKHNNVLWKEKCGGDIRLFLRRLGIGRTRRWVSRLNRSLFFP